MARTKASVGAKISTTKSNKARCGAAPPSSSYASSGGSQGSGDRSSKSSGGGNPVCPRPTPKWQKGIANFFTKEKQENMCTDAPGTSTSTARPKKRNIIESDDEEGQESAPPQDQEVPKNHALDESIELTPLTGENSHKIDEYYSKSESNEQENEESETSEDAPSDTDESMPKSKGKGIGKKTNKENVTTNITEKKKSGKRDLEKSFEESNHVSKKIKVH